MSNNLDMDSVIRANEHMDSINRKEIPVGSVAYFLENSKDGKRKINFGIVEEHYASSIALHLIERRDTRRIDDIPVKEFKTPTRWQKLPKGWSWNTRLFEITEERFPEELRCNIDDAEKILQLYKEGYLVNVEDNDHAHFRSEVDKKYGWRIVREYPMLEYHPSYISVSYYNVFTSYADAKAELDKIHAEYSRQADMSDYDWSVEQIDHELDRWAKLYSITDVEKQKYRDWILAQRDVEDIEVRVAQGGIQWKYWKNKRWLNIEV